MTCPHCIKGTMLLGFDGAECLQCGYVDYTNGRSFTETLELMAQVPNRSAPRFPAPTKLEVYEDEVEERRLRSFIATMQAKQLKRRTEDEALFKSAAERIGVEPDDLCGQDRAYSARRREVAGGLRTQGLSFQRIADVMEKSTRAVQRWFDKVKG